MSEPIGRILVIDDEAEILKPIVEAFKTHGFVAEMVANPLMVESLIAKTRYQAIITDFKMAHLDGAEVVRIVRGSLINRDTPVFVMSAFIDRPVFDELRSLGIQGVLVKPFRNAELVTRVKAALTPEGVAS